MQKVELYLYNDGKTVVVTPNKRNEIDQPSRMRLIADENAILINGETEALAVDVMLDEVDLWNEINSAYEASKEDIYNALAELGVE
jgi:hypothetical protein